MAQAPIFSVIIPTYERPAFLAEAIDSVLGQTVQDFEVLVVDDGSSVPVAVPDDPRVRLIRRELRGGAAVARNTGLAHAQGRFVCFLDDDDLYAPDRLAVVVEHLDRVPLVITWTRFLDGSPSPGRILEGDVSGEVLDGLIPQLGTVTVRRDLVVPFDAASVGAEDVEWWLRQSRVCPVATVPQFVHLMRRHQGPRDGYETAVRVDRNLQLLERYEEYFEGHPVARAFRWKRVGLMRQTLGDRAGARSAFFRSLVAHPELRTAWHLIRSSLLPRAGASRGRGR